MGVVYMAEQREPVARKVALKVIKFGMDTRQVVARFETVHPRAKTPAAALQGWSADWGRMVDARGRYADDLAKAATTGAKVRLILPAVNAIKPVTNQMDDFVRENDPHLKACFTTALQLEVVEGPRDYQKVTQ